MAMEPRWTHGPMSPSSAPHSAMSGAKNIRQIASAAAAIFRGLPVLRKIMLVASAIASTILIINILQFGSNILVWILPLAQVYSEKNTGWVGLWTLTTVVAFPPLFGFSSICALSGFVFGMKGWLVVATATVVGSTTTFLIARNLLNNTFKPFVARDSRFTSLTHLRQPAPTLLSIILARLSPLPYALSNAAFGATFPHVVWHQYALATLASSPRLLVHVFIGARLKAIAINVLLASGPSKDSSNTTLEYVAIMLALAIGIGSSVFAHRETLRRASQNPSLENPEFSYEVTDLSHPDTFEYDIESNSSEEEEKGLDARARGKAKVSPQPSPLPMDSQTFERRHGDFYGDGGSSGLDPDTGGISASGIKTQQGHSRERSSSNAVFDTPTRAHSRNTHSIDRESFDMGVSRRDED